MNDISQKSSAPQRYEFASVISLACIVAMIVAMIGFGQDLELQFRKEYLNWILKIPEWIVLFMSCACWCAIFLGISNYCKKVFNFNSSLFVFLVGIEVAIFLINLFIGNTESFAVIGLFFLIVIAYCIIVFIAGIQMNKAKINKYIPTSFIVYSVAYFVLILLLPAIIIDEAIDGSESIPLWVNIGSLIAELVPLYLINKVFSKITKEEDLEETRNEIFKNKIHE